MTHETTPPEVRHANRMQHVAQIYQEAERSFSAFYQLYTTLTPFGEDAFMLATRQMLALYHTERTAALLLTLTDIVKRYPRHQTVSLEWNDTLEEENEVYETIHAAARTRLSEEQCISLREEAVDRAIESIGEHIIGRRILARPTPELTSHMNTTRRNKRRHTIEGQHDMDLIYDYTNQADVKVGIRLKRIQ